MYVSFTFLFIIHYLDTHHLIYTTLIICMCFHCEAPCHTLKKCIDDRPEPDTSGVCDNDVTISCQEDSVCPIILGTGTCTESSFNNVRKVRIEIPRTEVLHMREVQVFDSNGVNVARGRFEPFVKQSNILQNNAAWGPNSTVDNNFDNLMQTGQMSSKF